MTDQPVLYEKRGRVVMITLNRPERLNAMNQAAWDALDEALGRFDRDHDAWCAVVTGAGRAFCAGADMEDLDRTGLGDQVMETPRRFYQTALGGIWKPIIAAVNGYALAAGWWIAQSCDIRIAADSAQFGIPETRWNLAADFVGDMTRLIGLGPALEIAMRGDLRISAQRAYEIGFVNRVVPDGELIQEALGWAEAFTRLGPRAVANVKQSLYTTWGMSTERGMAFARALRANLADMQDTREGPRAFQEKREPRYENR